MEVSAKNLNYWLLFFLNIEKQMQLETYTL